MAGLKAVRPIAILGIGIWSAIVVAGFVHLMNYEFEPGPADAPPAAWPSESSVERPQDRPTLLLFLHPRCPCSSASLEEFDRLLARVGRDVAATILFVRPPGAGEDWERTDLWASALRIPGVSVKVDGGGAESRLFRVETSGAVVLYDADGRLRFSGGITASRGHAGDNAGRGAVESVLAGEREGPASVPVFGCELRTPSDTKADPACPH